jgi:hypothetical protein
MQIIFNNTTSSDVEITDLGFTVPASGVYDASTRPIEALSLSSQIIGYITDGTFQLINDPVAPSYWTISEALTILQNGVNKNLLGLGDDTGYLQMASGSTAERPSSPVGGMTRFNTDTGLVEAYHANAWQNAGTFGNTNVLIASLYPGSGPFLSVIDPTSNNATLSVTQLTLNFSSANAHDKTWLQVHSDLMGTSVGHIAPFPVQFNAFTGFTDMGQDKSVSMFVDDVEYANVIVFSNSIVNNSVTAVDTVTVDAGQKVRMRVLSSSPGPVGAVNVTAYFVLRTY